MINKNSLIEIYTTSSCVFCHMAKEILQSHHLEYTEYDVKADPKKGREMMRRTRSQSVPQIFIDGEFIGGCHELKDLLD